MKKTIKIIILIVLLISINILLYFVINKKIENDKLEKEKIALLEEKNKQQKQELNIKNHYNKYVITIKETNLYDENKNIVGSINKDIQIELEDQKIKYDTKYFKIKNLNYYIEYDSVKKIDNLKINDRYKRYIKFNYNVTTLKTTTFYNENGYVYKINKGIDLPIIIKEKDKYYVSYNNELLYIKKEDSKIKQVNNTNEITRNNIRTFTYHAIYKKGEKCTNSAICEPVELFESQIKYLYDNNYLTLTMEELEMFLDGKIRIPTKTIVITLDDGKLAKNAIDILNKYKLYATYFVITGRYDSYKIKSEYVSFESHTDNLHNNYKCPGGEQGGQLLCEDENKILKDLKTSQDKLQGSKFFAYPFFDFNDRAINLLKKSGFKMAFIGQYNSEGYSDIYTDRMKLRRKTIFGTDSLKVFTDYLK